MSILSVVMPINPLTTYSTALKVGARLLKKTAENELEKHVDRTVLHLTDGIRNSRFNLPPLVPAYALRKSNEVGEKPILMRTEEYVNEIHKRKDEGGFAIGFEKGQKNEKGVDLTTLATRLEFGTSKSVARPHWRPTADWSRANLPTVGKAVLNVIWPG